MIVEPMAGDHVEDNLNPVGRAYYGFSTLLCTPSSLSRARSPALSPDSPRVSLAPYSASSHCAGVDSLRQSAVTG